MTQALDIHGGPLNRTIESQNTLRGFIFPIEILTSRPNKILRMAPTESKWLVRN